ncbi:hypothetical protein [Streptomyces sp. NPDC092129]|uniref:hypothetical protein n=1 Tax=Streptomyces sp. NPDC092129 TaxID=3366010 RepID=UPI0038242FF6
MTSGLSRIVFAQVDSLVQLSEYERAPNGRPCWGVAVIGYGVHVEEAVRELFSRPYGSGR